MIRAVLNIGLWDRQDQEIKIGSPVMYLECHGLHMRRMSIVRRDDQEPSLVLYVDAPHYDQRRFERLIYTAAELLGQDCIAVLYRPGDAAEPGGHLIGPNAKKWLPFDIARFEL